MSSEPSRLKRQTNILIERWIEKDKSGIETKNMARYSQQLQLDKSMERKMLFEPSSLNKILRTELKKKLNMS